MATLMKRQGLAYQPHGFRASFRTWVEENADAQFEVKEACLGHVVDAYQRSDRLDKRRALLELWDVSFYLEPGRRLANYCRRLRFVEKV